MVGWGLGVGKTTDGKAVEHIVVARRDHAGTIQGQAEAADTIAGRR